MAAGDCCGDYAATRVAKTAFDRSYCINYRTGLMSSYATLTLGSLELGTSRNGVDPELIWLFLPFEKHIEDVTRKNPARLAKYIDPEYIDEFYEADSITCVEYRCTVADLRDRLELKGFTLELAMERFNQADVQYEIQILETMGNQFSIFENLLFLRLIAESTCPDECLVYDLTHLVYAGYIDEEDDCVALAEVETNTGIIFHQKVIVLTEGKTDKKFLERSLKILYPHLADYFHFFDFNLNKHPGGAGVLANLVRAFAAASVEHRILALFDNDAAAKDALKNLDVKALPENIRICHYPNLAMAENYPTIGPSGGNTMNVNGLAGSIELYLGRDVLGNDEGELTPVQWAGCQRGVDAYQGEVLDKKKIQDRFSDKLKTCEKSPEEVESFDWDGIRAILDMMRVAFHSLDAQLIHSEVNED